MSRRRPENHGQHQIGRRRGEHKDSAIDVRVKHAPDRRALSAGKQAQGQHTSGHSTGDRRQQERQPEKPLLTAEGHQRQQHPRRRLHRP